MKRVKDVAQSMSDEDLADLDIRALVQAVDNERSSPWKQAEASEGQSNRSKKREEYAARKRKSAAGRKARRRAKQDSDPATAKQKEGSSTTAKAEKSEPDAFATPKPAKKRRLDST